MFHTPICYMFGIRHPIWLAGMGGVSMAPLVAAVSTNSYIVEWERDPSRIRPCSQQLMHSMQAGVMDYMGRHGDVDPARTFMPAGQSSGAIHGVSPAGEIQESIFAEAAPVLRERLIPLCDEKGAG